MLSLFFKQTHESGLNASFRFHPFFINRGFIFYNWYTLQTHYIQKVLSPPNNELCHCLLHVNSLLLDKKDISGLGWANKSFINLSSGGTYEESIEYGIKLETVHQILFFLSYVWLEAIHQNSELLLLCSIPYPWKDWN